MQDASSFCEYFKDQKLNKSLINVSQDGAMYALAAFYGDFDFFI